MPDDRQILPNHWLEQVRQWTPAKHSITQAHPEDTYGFEWWNNSIPANVS